MGRMALVFDLDDTLTDWWSAIRDAASNAAGEEKAEALLRVVRDTAWVRREDGAVHREHWRLRVEPSAFWRQVFPDVPDVATRVTEQFLDRLSPQLYEDVVPALEDVSGRVPLGVLSNSPFADAELERLGLRNRFTAVVGLEGAIRKPHPAAFDRICVAMACDPDEVVYVGDSPVADVEPALDHGMQVVWVDRYEDPWTPPEGVHRVYGLAELEHP